MNWKEGLAHKMELPEDLVLGAVIVTMIGSREAYVENYVSLLEYTPDEIILRCRNCRVEIKGESLVIAYFTAVEMKISGTIKGVSYC